MSFSPDRCPYEDCQARDSGDTAFFHHWGSFTPNCRNQSVPRFRCRKCKRTFSRQTFRHDFRQRLLHIEGPLLRQFVSGTGIRQSARILGVNRKTVARKLKRLSEQCHAIHDSLAKRLRGTMHWQFDELETFETSRLTMPVTMGALIDVKSRFIIEQENGTMAARGNLSEHGKQLAERHDRQFGKRRCQSREIVAAIFSRAAERLSSEATVRLTTDRKKSYPRIAKETLGEQLTKHRRVSGKLPRGPGSTLHPINLTLAMLRDGMGRLRRRSWLASKCRVWLRRHAWIYVAYRNYVRRRFNRDDETAGMVIGVQKKRWRFEDLIRWNAQLVPPEA